ncbi:Imm32 family immunity protein [Streptomyces sp. CB02460]|uniref:Imm32 family immunity protein n=1 Tax=Streptomyces sp. CB02460 TaxID=1703941 RepID=UPI001F5B2B0E|nr:hypothetical protein [Streptomyces sp. CB02460]
MTSGTGSAPIESTRVTAAVEGTRLRFSRAAEARIEVRDLGAGVNIEANAARLRTPAGHLLVLAGEGVPDGAHLHLEDSNGLKSVPPARRAPVIGEAGARLSARF